MGTPEAGHADGAGPFGLSSPTGDEQVEQDRASSVLVHLAELARSALAHPCGHRRPDLEYQDEDRTQGPLRAGQSQVPQGREAHGRTDAGGQLETGRVPRRLELQDPPAWTTQVVKL